MLVLRAVIFVLIYSNYNLSHALDEDDLCMLNDDEVGTCTNFYNCEDAIQLIRENSKPTLCGFDRFTPIVCCKRRRRSVVEDTTIKLKETEIPGCSAYNSSSNLRPDSINENSLELPHLAVLKYGRENKDIVSTCLGALISEKYVLTSATCANTELGQVKHVTLGERQRTSTTGYEKFVQSVAVKATYFHPERNYYSYYHDIALLELDSNVNFEGPVKPACLQTTKTLPPGNPVISDWIFLNYANKWLQTRELVYVPFEACRKKYKPQAYLEGGVRDDWQICAGDKATATDTCKIINGAPLQIKLSDLDRYTIVGITSFVRDCSSAPRIYTRVSYYVPWIESIIRQK